MSDITVVRVKIALAAIGIAAVFAAMLAVNVAAQGEGVQLRRRTDVSVITTHYGTFRAPSHAFVDLVAPIGVERVIVDVGECLCWSYPAAVTPGKLSVIPIALHGLRDQRFQVRVSPSTLVPYAGPTYLSSIPAVTKRRAVRR